MEPVAEEDFHNPKKIVVIYVRENGIKKKFYRIHRDDISKLYVILAKDKNRMYYSGEADIIDKIVSAQFTVNFEWLGDVDENTLDIKDDCKFIILGHIEDVMMTAAEYNCT